MIGKPVSLFEKLLMEMARPTEGLYKYKRNFAMKNLASLILIAAVTSLTFLGSAFAGNSCPGIGSPQATANNYMLFTAYQTGYDGYEAPCELKCFGNEGCQQRCQSKHGLRLLEEKLHDIMAKNDAKNCPSYTVGCVEQCEKLGVSCAAICGQNKPVADKNTQSRDKSSL